MTVDRLTDITDRLRRLIPESERQARTRFPHDTALAHAFTLGRLEWELENLAAELEREVRL